MLNHSATSSVTVKFLTSGGSAHVSFWITPLLLERSYNVIIIIFYYAFTLKNPNEKNWCNHNDTQNRPMGDPEGRGELMVSDKRKIKSKYFMLKIYEGHFQLQQLLVHWFLQKINFPSLESGSFLTGIILKCFITEPYRVDPITSRQIFDQKKYPLEEDVGLLEGKNIFF